jgi:TATA-box binding protein (TBP) (component of TFIID and TFIIIB)
MQIQKTTLRPELKIQNTVTTADLKQKIDITSFNKYKYLSSNLELYRCGYVKDASMTGRVTVFGSGKLISVGTKSPDQSAKELNCGFGTKFYALILGKHVVCTYTTAACAT